MQYYDKVFCTVLTRLLFSVALALIVGVPASAKASDLNQNGIEDSGEAEVVVSASATLHAGEHHFGTVIVPSGVTVSLVSDPTWTESAQGVVIVATALVIEEGATLSADGTGYTTTVVGPGTPTSTSRGGASHGANNSDNTKPWYGSAVWPRSLGSAGKYKGGGGAIEIRATNTTINGTITARGTESASGGSILIDSDYITGSGAVIASGGKFYTGTHLYGPGAGGRISFHSSENNFTGTTDVSGGIFASGSSAIPRYASPGTIAFFDTDSDVVTTGSSFRFQSNDAPHAYTRVRILGSVEVAAGAHISVDALEIITGQCSLTTESSLSAENITLLGSSTLQVSGGVINPAKQIEVRDNSRIVAAAGYMISLNAIDISIDAGAVISADTAGYLSDGPGSPTTLNARAGASYGGLGSGAFATSTYGDLNQPTDFGSGPRTSKIRGGGALSMTAKEIRIDGVVRANGGPSASGGSILVTIETLAGVGTIEANGGNFAVSSVYYGAGGGGRIAVHYHSSSSWSGVLRVEGGRNVSSSGSPVTYAQDGTVVMNQKKTGASSILFLPGIMGSHLYEESGECVGFGEQKRWFSHTDCEQLRLLTNSDGSSINDIYTKFEDEAIADKASKFGVTLEELYTNFIAEMNQLEGDQIIKDFTPFAYDWRLRLDQIIRMKKDSDSNKVRYVPGTSLQDGLLYKTISEMVARSHSGKVTIVSHSNGGLVAKAFMAELAESNDPLEAKIDNLILIGSPQVGTPDAVNGILHGTEIGPGGVVINQDTTRRILNTAPFGHHLLPNKYYFDGEGVSVQTPVINFKEGLATNAWRIEYGDSIDSFEELKRFLDDGSGRARPAQDDLKTPEVVDGTLLAYAEEIGNKLANWEPPSTLTVHQLGGSGIWTPSRVEYSSNEYCLRSVPIGFTCDAYTGVLNNKLHFVMDGDGTVVLPSALAMSESMRVNRSWLDIHHYNTDAETNNVHKNMLEIPEVPNFVSDIARSVSSTYRYIGTTPPPIPQDIRLLFHLHSPLDMYVTSDQGTVSSTTSEIPNAFYRRYGDVQYISLPSDVTNATLHMVGYETGSYTLYKELWEGETEISSVDFRALPTNSGTVVTLPVSLDEAGVMLVDFDGDGEVDGTVNESEDAIKVSTEALPIEEDAKEKNGNSGTRLIGNPSPQVAGISTVSEEEQLKRIIELLRKIISLLKIQHNL